VAGTYPGFEYSILYLAVVKNPAPDFSEIVAGVSPT
jgi:hypothetical protein